jgi:hypothetical protein
LEKSSVLGARADGIRSYISLFRSPNIPPKSIVGLALVKKKKDLCLRIKNR